MISGRVADDGSEATIKLSARGPTGRTIHTQAIVDTGFNGELSLHPQDIDDLRLPWLGHVIATLADESTQLADACAAEVLWENRRQKVTVTAIPGGPLIGMSLMKNYRLTIDIIPNGTLVLEKLESSTAN